VCVPDPTSGTANGGGDPYQSVIQTLGGVQDTWADPPAALGPNPFCESAPPAAQNLCEAGVFVAPPLDPNGVTVAPHGAMLTPLISSNSSIAIDSSASSFLNVSGTIAARKKCVSVSQFRLNWDGTTGTTYSTAPVAGCQSGGALNPDPRAAFHHEFWGLTAPANGSCAIDPTAWAVPAANNCGLVNSGLAISFTAADAGAACATGWVDMQPGIYEDSSGLNYLVQNAACKDVVVWFEPGVYYFDFITGGTVWGGSGNPLNSENPLWIVGGTKLGWSAPGPQPVKRMRPYTVSFGANPWLPGVPGDSAAVDATAIDGTSARRTFTDPSQISVTSGGGSGAGFGTAVNAHATVDAVTVNVAYNLPGSNGDWSQRRVDVSANGGVCRFTLNTGDFTPPAAAFSKDLTNGCTTAGGTVVTSGFPTNASQWTPAIVNTLQTVAQFQQAAARTTTVLFDGTRLDVNTHGAPSPPFPAACDATQPGVQFILGGQSQIRFDNAAQLGDGKNNSVFVDLCGPPPDAYSRHSPAIYGLTDHSGTSVCCGSVGAPWYKDIGYSASSVPSSLWDAPPVGYDAASALASDGDAYLHAGASWTNSSTAADATISFTVPANTVPPDAAIERVEFDVTHREGPDVSSLTLSVKRAAGSPGADWDTTKLPGPAFGPDPTRDSSGNIKGAGCGAFPCASWARWSFGVFAGPDGVVNKNWPNERWPSDTKYLGDPASLNGATVQLTAHGGKNKPGRWIDVDSIRMRIVYRPVGTLRPLRGCTTVRPGLNWQYSGAQPEAIPANPYMAGTDRDFAANNESANTYIPSDQAYTHNISTTACALIRTGGVRFTVDGSIYAPTAALDFDGNTNDTSLVTNAVVARQLTVTRYINAGRANLFGTGASTNDRVVTLYVYRTDTSPPTLLATAKATIGDNGGLGLPGQSVTINSWVKRHE
jgi:hypothetical protein